MKKAPAGELINIRPMVLISDGNSEIGANVRFNI